VIRFRFGRGVGKGRKDSADTSVAVIQQVAYAFTEKTFKAAKERLGNQISKDVRAELIHLQALYRRYIIGAAGSKSKPRGTLDTISKGDGAPRADLAGMLPSWAPRGAAYLETKKGFIGNIGWFDNTGWADNNYLGGYLRAKFKPEELGGQRNAAGGGGAFGDAGQKTMWESMFGPISVQVLRNRRGSLTEAPTLRTKAAKKLQIQLATIRVRALGSLTTTMLNAFGGFNDQLMNRVRSYDPDLAYRLGGRRNKYRPTLEPFLKFYLEKSIPQALESRLKKGDLTKTLFRN
jgi:hypothetical protein